VTEKGCGVGVGRLDAGVGAVEVTFCCARLPPLPLLLLLLLPSLPTVLNWRWCSTSCGGCWTRKRCADDSDDNDDADDDEDDDKEEVDEDEDSSIVRTADELVTTLLPTLWAAATLAA
jgi:hypothetical protein